MPSPLPRARSWWDGSGTTPVTSIYDGSSTSARLTGLMWFAIEGECPQAEYTGIAIEYGMVPVLDVMYALRAVSQPPRGLAINAHGPGYCPAPGRAPCTIFRAVPVWARQGPRSTVAT